MASPHVVRDARRCAVPEPTARNGAETVPQPTPGRHVPFGAGWCFTGPVRRTAFAFVLPSTFQYVLLSFSRIRVPLLTLTVCPLSRHVTVRSWPEEGDVVPVEAAEPQALESTTA